MDETPFDNSYPLFGEYSEKGFTHSQAVSGAAWRYLAAPIFSSTLIALTFVLSTGNIDAIFAIWAFTIVAVSLPSYAFGLFVGHDLYRLFVLHRKPAKISIVMWVFLFFFAIHILAFLFYLQSRVRSNLFVVGKTSIVFHVIFYAFVLSLLCFFVLNNSSLIDWFPVFAVSTFFSLFFADTWVCRDFQRRILSDGIAPPPPRLVQFSLGTLLASTIVLGAYFTLLTKLFEFLPPALK